MSDTVKILGTEVALSTASNVGNASAVRVYNNTAGAIVVTRANAAATTIGTMTLAPGEVIYLQKSPTDTLAAASAVRAVAVAF